MSTTMLPDEGPRVRVTANVDAYVSAMRSIEAAGEAQLMADGEQAGRALREIVWANMPRFEAPTSDEFRRLFLGEIVEARPVEDDEEPRS